MATPAQLQKMMEREFKAYEQVRALRAALSHGRFPSYQSRHNVMERLAKAEHAYKALYHELLKTRGLVRGSLFGKQVPVKRSGLSVLVDLSIDGFAFSNPAPVIPHGHKTWVRARIAENHTGQVGIPRSHELYHVTFSFSPVYTPSDGVPASGRVHFATASNPLTVTRQFIAPASGSTKHNFFVYIDIYERIDEDIQGLVGVP